MTVFSSREFSEINRFLASSVEREVGFETALDILVSQASRSKGREVLERVAAALRDGAPLPDALDRHPDAFAGEYRALIRAGFESGQPAAVFRAAEADYALRAELAGRVKRLTAYLGTGFALSVLVLIGSGLVWARMDEFYEVYFGGWLWWWEDRLDPRRAAEWVLFGLAVAVMLLWGLGFVAIRWMSRRRFGYLIPVWGRVLKSRDLALFCTSLSLKIRAGAAVRWALETSRQTLANRYAREIVRRARVQVDEGEKLSSAFFYHRFFPRTLSWAVSLGEERGDVAAALEELGRLYAGQVRRNFDVLFMVMTPLGILAVGNVVFLAASAVIMPMFAMMYM